VAAALSALLIATAANIAMGQDNLPRDEAGSNLDLMSGILHQLGDELRAVTAADSLVPIVVTIDAETDQWFIANAVTDALQHGPRKIYARADSVHEPFFDITLHVLTLGVGYSDEHRNKSTGGNDLERTVQADIRYLVVKNPSKIILADQTFSRRHRDLIDESALASLENPRIKCTQSAYRRDSVLDKMLEPFFIIGATGLAVYLLFHVRS
jgi:hypothetical protein